MEMKKKDIKEGALFVYNGEKYDVGGRSMLNDGNVVFVSGTIIFTNDEKSTDEFISVYHYPFTGLLLEGKIELNKCKKC